MTKHFTRHSAWTVAACGGAFMAAGRVWAGDETAAQQHSMVE